MKSIQKQKKEFKDNYKNNFISYSVEDRKMQLAWSGQPENPPLIFVHGSPGSSEAWAEFLVDKNLQKNFHVIAIDRPGYGGSAEGGVERSVQKQAAQIIAALQFNKSGKKAILIGHSYGGPVIARMAMDYPEKIAGLVFVAAALDPQYEKIKWYQYPATWGFFRWLLPTDLTVCNDEVMVLRQELEMMLPEWKKITAPSVIIQGDADPLVDPDNLRFLRNNLKGPIVKSTMVEGLNHFVPWKRSDLIFEGINLLKNLQK